MGGREGRKGKRRKDKGEVPCSVTSPLQSTFAANGHITENRRQGLFFNSSFPGEKTLAWRVVK